MAVYKRGLYWHMDAMVNGVRYREALNTTDKREATALEKKRIGEIQQGKGASRHGREFARKPFPEALEAFIAESMPHCAERTIQLYKERGRRLAHHFKTTPLYRIKAGDIAAFQSARLATGVGNRTVNMEVTVLRLMLRRAKVWFALAEDVKMLPEKGRVAARVLAAEQKRHLFATAASNDGWLVAYCAGVIAVNTSCRGVEMRTLRWADVNLFKREMYIRRSKTEAGHRTLPLNSDAVAAFGKLYERAQLIGSSELGHYVFPACEGGRIDPTRHQKSWRTAWRSMTRAAGLEGLRCHDMRHQCITELAEAGHSDATLMAIAGHMSRQMLEHYSHVRMAAKRSALDSLSSGLMEQPAAVTQSTSEGAIQ